MFDSFTSQWQSRVYKDHPGVDQFQMMFAVNSWSILLTLGALLLSGEVGASGAGERGVEGGDTAAAAEAVARALGARWAWRGRGAAAVAAAEEAAVAPRAAAHATWRR